jgi:hypothetical protein
MKIIKIALFLLSTSVCAADISEYEPDTAGMQTLSAFGDLSGGDWIEKLDGTIGAAYVDNQNGRIEFAGTVCTNFGDIEATVQSRVGYVWVVNEARDGMIEYEIDNCSIGRKIMFGLNTGGDGMEGLEVAEDGITFYLLQEVGSTIYTFVDDGVTQNVSPQVLFLIPSCTNAGDLAIRENSMIIVCENSPNIVEYSLIGDFISSNNKVNFNNTEVAYFTDNGFCAGGEPNELHCFTIDPVDPPPPPTEEICTYSGEVVVNIDTGLWDAQTVVFDCPTLTVSGTLQ